MSRRPPPRASARSGLALLVSRSLRRLGAVLIAIVAMACLLAAFGAASAVWDAALHSRVGFPWIAALGLVAIGAVLVVAGIRLMSWAAAIDMRLRIPGR